MNLKCVTFTGVDDQTSLDDIVSLSGAYPFVEWGVMLSATKTGNAPRYPSLALLETIGNLDISLSVHLNDRLAHCAATGTGYPLEAGLQFVPKAKRIQINLFQDIDKYPSVFHQMKSKASALDIQIILQAYTFDIPVVETACNISHNEKVVFLHDASGGCGIAGDFQKPVNEGFVGFAGGINKENVEHKLEQIMSLGFANPFWIDIESGVRTRDIFDLDKVERILRLAEPFVNP